MRPIRQDLSLGELAQRCGGTIEGDPETPIRGVAAVESAGPGDLVFAESDRLLALAETRHPAAILTSTRCRGTLLPAIRVENVRLAWAAALDALSPPLRPAAGIHPTSVIHPSARVAPGASIGPFCVVGAGAQIAENCELHAGVFIGDEASIGGGSVLHPRVFVGDRCILGARNLALTGAVIGEEGFGLARSSGVYRRMPHIGIVRTGNDVEIGANSTIDRAHLGETVIEDGVKIDNLVHVANNVRIGANTVIAAQVGVAGSSTIGRNVTIAGQVGIADHLTVGDGAILTGQAGVIGNVPAGTMVSGYPARPHREFLRAMAALARLAQRNLHRPKPGGARATDDDWKSETIADGGTG